MNTLLHKMSPTITNMVRMDHTHVLVTFHRYKPDTRPGRKLALVNTACAALEIHAQLEEEIFYPAMREFADDSATVDKSVPEHAEMRRLIGVLRSMQPTDARYDETFMELMRDVLHHVAEEETVLLPDAERRLGDRLGELGAQMTRRRLQLVGPRTGEIAMNSARAFPVGSAMMMAGALFAGSCLFRRAPRTR